MPEGQMTLAALVHLKARPGRSSHARTSLLPSARGSDTSPRKSPGMPPAIAAHHRLFHLVARRLPAAVFLALVLASPRLAAAARPSIVFILPHDQEGGLLEPMPNLRSLIIDPGAALPRADVHEPLCGPPPAPIPNR